MPDSGATSYSKKSLTIILLSAYLGYALDGYNMLILSFVIPDIQRGLGISATAVGTVISIQLVASILGGAIFGQIADRLGRKNGLLLSIIVYGVGALLSGFSWDLPSLLIFRFITGIGLGGEWGLGMTLVSEVWSHRRRGLSSGLIQSSFLLGISLAGIVATAMIDNFGSESWRYVLMSGAVPILLGLAMRIWLPESEEWQRYKTRADNSTTSIRRDPTMTQSPAGQSLRRGILGFLLVGGFMLAFYGVTSFMPTLISDQYHAGSAVASTVNSTVIWIAIPIYISIGALSDVLGRKKAMLLPSALMIIASVLLYITTHTSGSPYPGTIWAWALFWCYCLWYAGSGVSSLFGVWLSEIFPVHVRATAVSLTYMLGRGASAVSPVLVPGMLALGFVSGAHPLGPPMAILSIAGVAIMLAAGLALPETKARRSSNDQTSSGGSKGSAGSGDHRPAMP